MSYLPIVQQCGGNRRLCINGVLMLIQRKRGLRNQDSVQRVSLLVVVAKAR